MGAATLEAQRASQVIAQEKERTLLVMEEARAQNHELQQLWKVRTPSLENAGLSVQKERESTSQVALEAKSCASSVNQVVTNNVEKIKICQMSLNLQVQRKSLQSC